MSGSLDWVDTHCHLDAPEFQDTLAQIVSKAKSSDVKALLVPTVKASDWDQTKKLVHQYSPQIPGLVYTLGIHPLYINQAQESDIDALQKRIQLSLGDPRFVGIGEIGLDYFVEGLDPRRQEYFFHAQLDLADQFQLPVILHVRRSQDAILKALRKRKVPGGIAHAFNGSHQQAEQFIELGFKLGFGGAATYDRALQIRRLLLEMPIESIVTETDAPDIPPAWLRGEGGVFNEPALLPRIARQLADIRGINHQEFATAVWQNAMQVLPRWSSLMTSNTNSTIAS
ncbi:MAG TPA: TatD family hydrolase [Polynucleobacter sp.]|jgi:TatD DNase family protein|nr:MAG: DNAase [Polynucleobacter sp. 16-46-70]HQR83690.1 TatD family hydrolase [Polynucleobacter sp.]HQS60722.1 TatD family hydrolase [Polynucleobacter sp.]HQT20149.1 TatD family hydrolase [Polynucleobacter sp.]HQT40712.1 TatD family hydrolase [Polynucleobacter sp.]